MNNVLSVSIFFQMCVSKCPDKFATYTEMQLQHKLSKSHWEYYRQFCKPGFNNPGKVPIVIYGIHLLLFIVWFDKLWLNKANNLQHRVQYYNIVSQVLFKM